jgi:hypothetical protein
MLLLQDTTGTVPVDEAIASFQKHVERIQARAKHYKDAYGKLRVGSVSFSHDNFFLWHTRSEIEKSIAHLRRLKGKDAKAVIARADAALIDDAMKRWDALDRGLEEALGAVKGDVEAYEALREKVIGAPRTPELDRAALELARRERSLWPRINDLRYDYLERAVVTGLGPDRARSESLARSQRAFPGQAVPVEVDGQRMYPAGEAHRRLWRFFEWLWVERNHLMAYMNVHGMWGLDSKLHEIHEQALSRSVGQMSGWVKESDVVYFEDGMRLLRADQARMEKELADLEPACARFRALDQRRLSGTATPEEQAEFSRLSDDLNAKFAAIQSRYLDKVHFQEIGNERDRYLITGFHVNDREYDRRKVELEAAVREGEAKLKAARGKADASKKALEAEASHCAALNEVLRKLKEAADDASARAALAEPEDKEKSARYREVEAELKKARRGVERMLARVEEEDVANRKAPSESGDKTVAYYKKELEAAASKAKALEAELLRLQDGLGFTARRAKAAADAVELFKKYRARVLESEAQAKRLEESREAHEKDLGEVETRRKAHAEALQALEKLKATVALRVTAAKVYDETTLFYDAYQWAPTEGLALIDEHIAKVEDSLKELDDLRYETKLDFLKYNHAALEAGEDYEAAIMQSAFYQATVEAAYFGEELIQAMCKKGPPGLIAELAKKSIEIAVFGPMKLEEVEVAEIDTTLLLPTPSKAGETAAKRLLVKQPLSNAAGLAASKYVESQSRELLRQAMAEPLRQAAEIPALKDAVKAAVKKFAEAKAKATILGDLKGNAKSFLEGMLKDVSKAAAKKLIAEYFEGQAASDYFGKQALAAGATQLYLLASHRYWKAFDLRSNLRSEREAVLRTWDPAKGLTTAKNDWFKRGRTLTIELTAVPADGEEAKAGAKLPEIEVKLGGQPAERYGEKLHFRVDTFSLKNNGGGVTLEVVVRPR